MVNVNLIQLYLFYRKSNFFGKINLIMEQPKKNTKLATILL